MSETRPNLLLNPLFRYGAAASSAAVVAAVAILEPPERVDLVAVARTVADQYRETNPDAEISLSGPEQLVVSTRRPVVRRVLSELVDNAVTHSDQSAPTVEITLREGTDATAVFSVADTGPGIPDRERQVVADGTETQFEHGRGIGLWFVSWAVGQLGGDLRFDENSPRGSVVTVRLYGSDTKSDN